MERMKRFAVIFLSLAVVFTTFPANFSLAMSDQEIGTSAASSRQLGATETDTQAKSDQAQSDDPGSEAEKKENAQNAGDQATGEEKSSETKSDKDKSKAESKNDSKSKDDSDKANKTKQSDNGKKKKEAKKSSFTFEDNTVVITATENEAGVLPEGVSFVCRPIDEKSEKYLKIRDKIGDFYDLDDDRFEILPYDVCFLKNGSEVEPEDGSVDLKFEFKKSIKIDEQEKVSVVHIDNDNKPEKVKTEFNDGESLKKEKAIKEFEVKLDSLSPVVLTRANVMSAPALKSIKKTDENGNEYYISKTANIGEDGTATSLYANSQNVTDTISINSGFKYIDVTIKYGGESISFDYLYIKDGSGNILYKDDEGKTIGSTNSNNRGKIGGAGADFSGSNSGKLEPANEVTYRFEQDKLQFSWRTDGSVQGYGYYAVITPVYPDSKIPDYHFEELEDGTYALVFDKGGDIDTFMSRPDNRERVAEYKDKISEIRLHKDTTAVLDGSFKNLTSLKKVTMPRNSQLTTIGKNVFAGCDNLESFDVPATVTEIAGSAFKGCKSLETVNFAAANEMTELPDGLFSGLTGLKNVTLPQNLTAISNDLFNGCTSLANIDVPDGVKAVGNNAFKNTKIKDVSFLDHVESIGSSAFSGCTNINEVNITPMTTSIGSSAFNGCTGITDFIFEEGTSFEQLPTYLFQNCSNLKNVKLPGNLKRIPNYCFNGCSKLEMVDIPDTVTAVGDYAFKSCSALKDFEIPAGVKTLGPYAFQSCTSLKDMTIPKTVTSVGSNLFYGCTGLIRASFEDGSPVTSLPSSMFSGCSRLEDVKLPDGVTEIPASYFYGCTSLRHVELPDKITKIGDSAFYNCYNMEDIPLKNGLKTIGNNAFYNCDKLTDIVIPKSVTSIGSNVWQNCDGITSVVWEEGSPMTTLNSGLFSGCKNLENLVLPTNLTTIPASLASNCPKLEHVVIPEKVTRIQNNAFDGDSKLNDIELPANCTQIDSYAFRNTGLTHIEFPEKPESYTGNYYIGDYAFAGTQITDVTIPRQATSVGSSAFRGCTKLETVTFEEGGRNTSIGSYAFANCPALKDVDLKEGNTTIGSNAFQNDKRLSEIEIPSTVTQISNYAFQNDTGLKKLEFTASDKTLKLNSSTNGNAFGKLTSVEELVIDRNITSDYKTANTFADINPDVKITIGEHVDTLDNMFVSMFTDKTEIEFKGENDFSVSTRIANTSKDNKWKNLKGDFYVDEKGVVYKLNNADNTASVFHVPAGLEEYTVPETVTSVAGNTYTINKIEPYAVRDAEDLTALTVTKPENVSLPQFSLSKSPMLQTVNGKTEIFPEDDNWADVSTLCGFPIHSDKESEQVLALAGNTSAGEGTFSYSVTVSKQEKMEDDGLTYVYPTGAPARLDFAISNESNLDMSNQVIRIYFAFDGDEYHLGDYPPGEHTLVNTQTGRRYPFKVRETDVKGVYCYEISGFKPGDTLGFFNQYQYNSPASAGGTMRVWAETLTKEENEAMAGKVSDPGQYIKAKWYTTPVSYNVSKAVSGNPKFEFVSNSSSEDDENIYVRNMSYRIELKSSGAWEQNQKKDYIKYVDFQDDLKLNENMIWSPDVIEAIKNNDYYLDSSNYLFAKIDGKWVHVCNISFPDTAYVRSIRPEVVTDANGNEAIRLHWSYKNQYWSDTSSAPTADLPATTYTVTYGERAVQVKPDSELWKMFREGKEFTDEESEAMRKIANEVSETRHYSFSNDQTSKAETAHWLIHLTTGFEMTKNQIGSYARFGLDHGFRINMKNTGLIHKTDIDLVEDKLNEHYYIEADDIEKMLKNPKWGAVFRLDISSATLCKRPDVTATDVYGNTITSQRAQDFGAEPIPYSGTARTDNSVITAKAKLSIYWNEDHSHIIMEVKGDDGTVQRTITIGNGCDFATIQEAIDDIGYVVTYHAVYKVSWDLGDAYTLYKYNADEKNAGAKVSDISELTPEQIQKYEYKLKAGRTDSLDILAKTKKTTMFLTEDTPHRYQNNSNSIYSSNTAYAKDDEGKQVGTASWTGYLYKELSLGKSAVANGKSYSSGLDVPDGTTIDYTLSFTNSGATYDVLPLTDRMAGAQMLIVPVRSNRSAVYYPEGETEGRAFSVAELSTYNAGGIEYYILDKSGTYKNVNIDGRKTDTITVKRSKGQIETLMSWYYQNVTGYSSNEDSVTRSITYRALADSKRAAEQTTDDQGASVTTNTLGNEAWLGGHQTHRLYAALGGKIEQMQFSKSIVENPGASHENLIGKSLIEADDEVLYKIVIKNTGDNDVIMKGSSFSDWLPSTAGIFAWTKDNVKDIYYVSSDGEKDLGSEVSTVGKEYWDITSIQPGTGADTAERGQYYIEWNNDFTAEFDPKGELWIYVKLKFPGESDDTADAWDNYIAANNGAVIYNRFYIGQRYSTVSHELVDVTEGILQKGVLDTGLSRSGYFQSEDTRHFYQNGGNTDNGSIQETAYYTVIYNSGNVRLYLDPMQDQLPKGFKFRSLFCGIPTAANTGAGFNTGSFKLGNYSSQTSIDRVEYRRGSDLPVATVSGGNKKIVYKNASVSATTSEDADGHQQVKFTFGRYSNDNSYLKYDSELNKFYLDPGEAIRFGYNCEVQGYKRTENEAENEISMPVYDKYGLGVQISEDVTVTPATYRDIARNDGECVKTTTEEEEAGYNHTKPEWAKSTTDWFSSNVAMRRLTAVPGLLKTIGGETKIPSTQPITADSITGSKYTDASKTGDPYVGTIGRTSIANWMIRAYNEGGTGSNSMEDFWIEDTVDAPYMFTGNFFYDYYNVNGTKMTANSVPLFSLGGRAEDDMTVKISTGQGGNTMTLDGTLTINGAPVSVDGGRAEVQLLRDENTKKETIRIHFADNMHRIPPNTYMALIAHTQYVSSDIVMSDQFYNRAELIPTTDFDPSMVAQGKVMYRENEEGEQEGYAVAAGASVTMTAGYSSAARKQVTELGRNSNTGWSDKEKNAIILPDKFSQFYYDLYVDLPEEDMTSRLVLIDSLPEPDDHSPFVGEDKRESDFVVHMLKDDPGFTVWSGKRNQSAKTPLSYDQYTLEVSSKTEFNNEDWKGNTLGWSRIDLSDGVSAEEKVLLENARSFRVILDDPKVLEHPENALMGKDYEVQIRFNAELQNPDVVDPGKIAWNSFGYRYTVPIGTSGFYQSLDAEPKKVGVMVPAVPYISKAQKTPHDHYKPIDKDSEYRFLIYSGSAIKELDDTSEMSMSDIADILDKNKRDVLLTKLRVEGGASSARTDYLDEENKWKFDAVEKEFKPTDEHWSWADSGKYTIIELPWEENGFTFHDIQHSPVNNYTFTQNSENNIVLRVTNEWNEKGGLKLSKTVNGPSFDANRKFTFTIQLKDGKYPAFGTYAYKGTNIKDGTLTFNDSGEASIQLRHDQAIELKGIPEHYTYKITESDDQLYDCSEEDREVSGQIEKNQVQNESFTNTRKDTKLSVEKVVTGSYGEKDKLFDFEMYIVDEGRELTGKYNARITHEKGEPTDLTLNFAEGAAEFQLKHGDVITVSGLPVGARYSVDELARSREGYSYESVNETGVLTLDPSSSDNYQKITYTNLAERGDLSLEKTVEGPCYDPDRPFEFTIHMESADKKPLTGNFNYVGTNIDDGTLEFNEEGNATISLHHGQKIQLKRLPSEYRYMITEKADEQYSAAANNDKGTIETDQTKEAEFTNTRNTTGINISKIVSGNHADLTKQFEFELKIHDGDRALTGSYQGVITHSDGKTDNVDLVFTEPPSSSVTGTASAGVGIATFQLKHGDSISVTGLPLGASYEVEEMEDSRVGYDPSVTNESGTLTATAPNVSFTNTVGEGNLKLQKTVDGPSFDADRPFRFTIQLKEGLKPVTGDFAYTGTGGIADGTLTFDSEGKASVDLKHNQAIEIKNIPAVYTYEITEAQDADGLYTQSSKNAAGTLVVNETRTASFTNTRNDTVLMVSKQAEGNLADRTKQFEFTVTINDTTVGDEGRLLTGTYDTKIVHYDGAAEDGTIVFENGAASFKLKHGDTIAINGLPVSADYSVTETEDSSEGYTAEWENASGKLSKTSVSVSCTNTVGKNLYISKLGEDDKTTALPGAEMQILDGDKVVYSWTSGAEPEMIKADLEKEKEYILHEVSAPDGYVLADDVTFTISDNGEIVTKTEIDSATGAVQIIDPQTEVSIVKVGGENGEPLQGAEMQILDGDEVVYSWTSGEEPEVIRGKLVTGKVYTIHEATAPDGYSLADDITFTVSEKGKIETDAPIDTDTGAISINDPETEVSIIKLDEETKKPLQGAEMQILDGDKVVYSWTSGEEPEVISGILVTGKVYTIHEATAPDGYELADDSTFTISDDGKVMTKADTDSETGAIMIFDPLQEDDDITGFEKYKSELEERNRLLEEANFKKLRDSGLPEGTPGKLRGVVEKEDKEKPVKTGDPAHISLAIMLLLASTLVIILPLFRRRKSE